MEEKINTTNEKIGGRLDKIDKEIMTIKDKIDNGEQEGANARARMDERLSKLEIEMEKSLEIRERRRQLMNQEKKLDFQPDGSDRNKGEKEKEEKDRRMRNEWRRQEQEEREYRKEKTNVQSHGRYDAYDQPRRTNEKVKEDAGEKGTEKNICYKSTWATGIQKELEAAAEMEAKGKDTRRMDRKEIPDSWEKLLQDPTPKKKTPKIRRPIIITNWFGDESEESETTTEDEGEWNEIDRIRKNRDKIKAAKDKKKKKEQMTALKAQKMMGIGPITKETLDHFEGEKDPEAARRMAVKEILMYKLGFTNKELDEIDIKETKQAKSEDIVYFAVENTDTIREIYYRKADSKNDEINLRNYIPPQFHARYMALNRECTEQRSKNQRLKTQIRFGKQDIELFTKEKGSDEGFKKIKLEEFMNTDDLPRYDHSVKWKIRVERNTRRKIDYSKMKAELPSRRKSVSRRPDTEKEKKQTTVIPAIIRQHSSTGEEEARKKHKKKEESSSSSSSGEEEEGSGYEEEEDIFENQEEWDEQSDKPAGISDRMEEDEQL